jgi:hypothetical protein
MAFGSADGLLGGLKNNSFLAGCFLLASLASAAAQRTSPVLVFAQHNLTFEGNDKKVVLHWMATQQTYAQVIKITCRLANSANKAILFEWEGTTPGNQPAIGRVELGVRERTMVLGLRGDRPRHPWADKDLVTCHATDKMNGGLKYDASVRLTEARIILGEEGSPNRLQVRVFYTSFGTPDKQSNGTIRCALLRGSSLQEVVEFETVAEPDGAAAMFEIPIATGRFATGVNCIDAWPRPAR